MYSVYILRSKQDKTYYIGYTSNLSDRIKRHNQGRSRYTRKNIPWELVYHEEYESKQAALKRERQLKSYKSGNALKQLLENSGI
jgi:putative endonuclease